MYPDVIYYYLVALQLYDKLGFYFFLINGQTMSSYDKQDGLLTKNVNGQTLSSYDKVGLLTSMDKHNC